MPLQVLGGLVRVSGWIFPATDRRSANVAERLRPLEVAEKDVAAPATSALPRGDSSGADRREKQGEQGGEQCEEIDER